MDRIAGQEALAFSLACTPVSFRASASSHTACDVRSLGQQHQEGLVPVEIVLVPMSVYVRCENRLEPHFSTKQLFQKCFMTT